MIHGYQSIGQSYNPHIVRRTPRDIAFDNDTFRATMIYSPRHKTVLSESVANLREHNPEKYQELLTSVREFSTFNEDNDPHEEHDFGSIVLGEITYFWKIDYFDSGFKFGLNPYEGKTALVLTIMEASEY
jgi:hypothetical protein